jgi:prepilin-type N-terminal cleavage/methylation domain-containing protein
MKSIHRAGFTLIELLVVIAIIGVLSAVVLGSLTTARDKAADASVRANLSNIRAQSEIQYDNTGNYGTASAVGECSTAGATSLFKNSVIASQIGNATSTSGGLSSCLSTGTPADNWAVIVQLKSDRSLAVCTDTSGQVRTISNSGTDYDQTALDADIAGAVCGS